MRNVCLATPRTSPPSEDSYDEKHRAASWRCEQKKAGEGPSYAELPLGKVSWSTCSPPGGADRCFEPS
ncbi:hypothetical protein E2C01_034822 [Portunus trituberculatus]|uniref:Uncharacterized protein n=1 Tax=Portunus trituberculatus TaxID=210409 RepID=A0A5B7F6J4_PORTR|nr:hypothetical protein [Portunus trituberculatus]